MKRTGDAGAASESRRPLGVSYLRWVLPWVLVAGALLIVILALGREVGHHVDVIESWIEALGPWAVVGFIVLFVLLTSLFVPDTLLAIVAGALFGPGWGVAAVLVAGILAAAAQYTLSSRLLRSPVEAAIRRKPSLAAIRRAVMRDELHLQVLLRLTPLNPATISYLLGAAGVRFSTFLLACLALTPSFLTEVYFGQAGRHIARIVGRGGGVLYGNNLVFLGGLAACIVVLVVVSKRAHQALLRAIAPDGRGEAANRTAPVEG